MKVDVRLLGRGDNTRDRWDVSEETSDGAARQEGRYRVRFVKAASSASVEPRGVWNARVGGERILF